MLSDCAKLTSFQRRWSFLEAGRSDERKVAQLFPKEVVRRITYARKTFHAKPATGIVRQPRLELW